MNFRDRLGDKKFDVITIADVLEHLKKPERVLQLVKEHLDKEGYIVASIPNAVHAAMILDMAKGRFDYNPYGLLDDTHIRFFTLKSICQIFELSGLRITGIERIVRAVEDTEFNRHPLSPAETQVIEFIKLNNPEFETYQFIVTANIGTLSPVSHAELIQLDDNKELRLEIASLESRIRTLNSRVQWITSRPAYKFAESIKSGFKKFVSRRA
jgi:SAM-dependent methyltransferase